MQLQFTMPIVVIISRVGCAVGSCKSVSQLVTKGMRNEEAIVVTNSFIDSFTAARRWL